MRWADAGERRYMSLSRLLRPLFVGLLVIAASTFALPLAAENFTFDGHGFGTILAQNLTWISWRLVADATANHTTTSQAAVMAVLVLINSLTFLILASVLSFVAYVSRAESPARWFGILTLAYLAALFVAPQARFGP